MPHFGLREASTGLLDFGRRKGCFRTVKYYPWWRKGGSRKEDGRDRNTKVCN